MISNPYFYSIKTMTHKSITHKEFLCADSFYDFEEVRHLTAVPIQSGNDCLFRAIHIQSKFPALVPNFGIPWFRGQAPYANPSSPQQHKQVGQYYEAYQWHVWLEDGDAIYDCCLPMSAKGHNVGSLKSIMLIDAASLINPPDVQAYWDWMDKVVANQSRMANPPDAIFFYGISINAEGDPDHSVSYDAYYLEDKNEFEGKWNTTSYQNPLLTMTEEVSEEEFYNIIDSDNP